MAKNRAHMELWGVMDIAAALQVAASTVYQWRNRADFPSPLGHPSNAPVWDAEEVRRWRRDQLKARRRARAF